MRYINGDKKDAHKLINRMPLKATWDDLPDARPIFISEAIECVMADSNEGRIRDVKEVHTKYGVTE